MYMRRLLRKFGARDETGEREPRIMQIGAETPSDAKLKLVVGAGSRA